LQYLYFTDAWKGKASVFNSLEKKYIKILVKVNQSNPCLNGISLLRGDQQILSFFWLLASDFLLLASRFFVLLFIRFFGIFTPALHKFLPTQQENFIYAYPMALP
jgi:hypothetical protein